ncbi:MAG: GNAT family N-acetyltransferase [Fimbriimonadaceae bacterium]|nr:GNAT family N-acetyltransferase [Fimbriimonadaceae bacterium]
MILRGLQDALVKTVSADRDLIQCGVFTLMLTSGESSPWLNYAVPTDASAPLEKSIDEMEAAFEARERRPRLEIIVDLWPTVVEALISRGYTSEMHVPLMLVTPQRPVVEPRLIDEVRLLGPQGDFGPGIACGGAAFADDETVTEAAIERTRNGVVSGRLLVAQIERDGKVVGSGVAVGDDQVREIAGIGTRPEYRRQGIASAVSEALVRAHFARGGEIAWLTAGDDAAEAVYAGLGFERAGSQINLSKP